MQDMSVARLGGGAGAAAVEAYLGVGSNLGRREQHLARAVRKLRSAGEIAAVSGLYESAPVGVTDQPFFLNIVVCLRTALDPNALLQAMLRIEKEGGRVRTFPGGPRTIDVDLLLYGDRVVRDEELLVPHPRMVERAFVLAPLLELEPRLVEPGTGRPYAEYLSRLMPLHGVFGSQEVGRQDSRRAPGLRRVMDWEELLDEEKG